MSRIEKALEKLGQRQKQPIPQRPLGGEGLAVPFSEEVAPTITLQVRNPHVIGFTLKNAAVAEEFRKLRSMILKMTKKDEQRNTLMVTSSESGEGKTLTTINLALMLAQEFNHTVLLVDADLRRPMVQSYLGVKPSLGLSDCLADNLDISRAIVRTGIPKLSLLTAGRKCDAPAELLSSVKMKVLIQELKHRYPDRYVIIDTPPALLFSDTQVMSSFVDGVLFVVKEGVALSHVREALTILQDSPVLGIVYNNADPLQQDGKYYHYHNYYHYQTNGQNYPESLAGE